MILRSVIYGVQRETKTKMKPFKLKSGSQVVPVRILSRDTMEEACRLAGHTDPETVIGAYKASGHEIWMRSDAEYDTLVHEILEYISSEYCLEISHEQLSVMAKGLAEIQLQNKNEFKKLLK